MSSALPQPEPQPPTEDAMQAPGEVSASQTSDHQSHVDQVSLAAESAVDAPSSAVPVIADAVPVIAAAVPVIAAVSEVDSTSATAPSVAVVAAPPHPPPTPTPTPTAVVAAAAAATAPIDKVPFRDLFQFATSEEIWLMRFACLCAAGLGLVFPLFSILFGDLLNSLNGSRSLSDIASDFSLKFLIIAICAGFGGSVSYGLPVYVAERQMKRVRELYATALHINRIFVTISPGTSAAS
jgi:hypothetical protein